MAVHGYSNLILVSLATFCICSSRLVSVLFFLLPRPDLVVRVLLYPIYTLVALCYTSSQMYFRMTRRRSMPSRILLVVVFKSSLHLPRVSPDALRTVVDLTPVSSDSCRA